MSGEKKKPALLARAYTSSLVLRYHGRTFLSIVKTIAELGEEFAWIIPVDAAEGEAVVD